MRMQVRLGRAAGRLALLAAAAAAIGLGAPSPAAAADAAATVGNDSFETLQAAIDAVQDGGTVTLQRDVTESVSSSGKSYTLDLGGHTVTAAAPAKNPEYDEEKHEETERYLPSPVLDLAGGTVKVKNGTLTGGKAGSGGGIAAQDVALTVEGVDIRGNAASQRGGAICSTGGGSLAVTGGSKLEGNTAGLDKTFSGHYGQGGAVYSEVETTLNGVEISGNRGGYGAALYLGNFSELNAVKCTIADNSDTGDPGLKANEIIRMGRGSINEFIGCTVSGNHDADFTVAVYGSASFVGGRIESNRARYVGGVFVCRAEDDTFGGPQLFLKEKAVVTGNTAESTGSLDATGRFTRSVGGVAVSTGAEFSMAKTVGKGETVLDDAGAVYGNSSTGGDESAPDLYIKGGSKVNVVAPKEMNGSDEAFAGYCWLDRKNSFKSKEKLPATEANDRYLAAIKETALNVAQVGDEKYESLGEAVEAAADEGTVKLIAGEDGATVRTAEFDVDKKLTLDLNGRNLAAEGSGKGKNLFAVAEDGDLAVTGKGDLAGDIGVSGGKLDLASVGKLDGTVRVASGEAEVSSSCGASSFVNQGGKLSLSGDGFGDITVALGKDETLTVAEGFKAKSLKLVLPDELLKKLNGEEEIQSFALIDGDGAASILDEKSKTPVSIDGLENYAWQPSIDEDGKVVIKKDDTSDAVYLDGTAADGNGDGTETKPVNTFEKAKELLEDDGKSRIIVTGTVTVSEDETWSGDKSAVELYRGPKFDGALVKVEPQATLALTGVTIDGGAANGFPHKADAPLIEADGEGAALQLQDRAVLQNNARYLPKTGNWILGGGASATNGASIVIDGGAVRGNSAVFGGGVYAGDGSKIVIKSGDISGNSAVWKNGATFGDESPDPWDFAFGGGVMLGSGSSMEMSGGAVKGNYSDGNAGGIALGNKSSSFSDDGNTFEMTGGSLEGNRARRSAGGLYVQSNCTATIGKELSGEDPIRIEGNSCGGKGRAHFAGGAIYVNKDIDKNQNHGRLYLYDAVVTGNEARSEKFSMGGGIASCITGRARLYLHRGGAVFGNSSNTAADDVLVDKQFDGDSTAVENSAYISPVMLGGGAYGWTYDSRGHASSQTGADGQAVPLGELSLAKSDLYLKANPSQEGIGSAWSAGPKVVISGNWTDVRNGGGIANNGDLIIGKKTDLTVAKRVESPSDADKSKSFHFKVELYKIEDDNKTPVNGKYGDMEFQDGVAEFDLRDGESKSAWGLPAGEYEYKVTETGPGGFTTAWEDTLGGKGEGTVATGSMTSSGEDELTDDPAADRDTAVLFTNTAKQTPPDEDDEGDLDITKKVVGDNAPDAEFTFTVTTDPAVPDGTYGDAEFKDGSAAITLKAGQTAHITGLPKGTEYTVTEADAEGFTPSIDNARGTITAGKVTVTATNTYEPEEPVKPDEPDNPGKPDEPEKPGIPDEPETETPDGPAPELPQTGDASLPASALAAVAVAGAALVGGGVLLKRRNRR